ALAPILTPYTYSLSPQHLEYNGIPVRTKIARVFVPLADLERHRADPVQERGIVQRLGDGRECRIEPLFSIEPGIGEDLVPVLAMPVALVLDRGEASGPKIVAAYP